MHIRFLPCKKYGSEKNPQYLDATNFYRFFNDFECPKYAIRIEILNTGSNAELSHCVQVPATTCLASTRHQWQYSRLNQHCQQEVRGSVHQVLCQPHWKRAQVISNLKKKIVPDQVLDGPDPHQPQKK